MSQLRPNPDRMYSRIHGADAETAHNVAILALKLAQENAPKLTGRMAREIEPIWGEGWFGLRWDPESPLWFQERGTRPRTMRELAGKTIPMWVDDPMGELRRQNPKASTRTTLSGKIQVLIFRRAAKLGQRKMVRDSNGQLRETAASYPGAPGRIANRDAAAPWTARGRKGGQIRPGNVGVRWRHPGISRRGFIRHAIQLAAATYGYHIERIDVATRPQPWMTKK